jgi:hypothetical protein
MTPRNVLWQWHCEFLFDTMWLFEPTNTARRVIMGANIAGIYGAQIFREDDKPRYRRAFSIACAVLAFGIALAIFRFLDDFRRRRRDARRVSDTPTSGRDESPQKWQTVNSTPVTPHNGQVVQVVVDGCNPGVSQDWKT